MTNALEQLAAQSVLREHRFESRSAVAGAIIVRLRSVWYNMAARWGDEAIINQQVAFNQAVTQYIAAEEQRIAALVAEHDQRLILADRDLTILSRTVAELTHQVVELRQTVEELRAARPQL